MPRELNIDVISGFNSIVPTFLHGLLGSFLGKTKIKKGRAANAGKACDELGKSEGVPDKESMGGNFIRPGVCGVYG